MKSWTRYIFVMVSKNNSLIFVGEKMSWNNSLLNQTIIPSNLEKQGKYILSIYVYYSTYYLNEGESVNFCSSKFCDKMIKVYGF